MTTRRHPARRPAVQALLIVGLVTVPAGSAFATIGHGTTALRTIGDADGDNLLDRRGGESHLVRQDLAPAKSGRGDRRVAKIFFGQQTDLHVIDEESPLRVEFVDKIGPPLTSAYRPQEGLSPHGLESMARQLRYVRSPITVNRLDAVMTTGDNSDNTQLNETRWFIDILDGGKSVDPNSGVPGTCGTSPNPASRYDGVRGGNEFYEPDSSGPLTDGPGYSPDEGENTPRSNAVRDFPGLYEDMNKPFTATGLGLPWYGIFGNHDGLIQGNQPRNPALEAYATGCVKVTSLSPTGQAAVAEALRAGGTASHIEGVVARIVMEDAKRTAQSATPTPTLARNVPSDARRRPLRKREYIMEHFRTSGTPYGHGFTQRNVESGQGNYTVSVKPGVRFIVLDSMNEKGGANGNIDDPQFRWLHGELLRAESRKEVAFAFAHHSVRTLDEPPVSAFGVGDEGGEDTNEVHFGGDDETQPCPLTDPRAEPTKDETLRCLFLRHPSLVGYISGHEHINRITPFRASNGQRGSFWEITTASHIDYPQQSRVIDLLDNRDGTLSIVGTIVDHAAPTRPESATSRTMRLAAIDRELSFNDPDAENGEDGSNDARGARTDRNVELLIRNPYGS